MKKARMVIWALILLLILGPLWLWYRGEVRLDQDWRTASRASAGLAPLAKDYQPALVQVYGARAFSWRGAYGIHTWLAYKRRGERQFHTLQVLGWRARRGQPVIEHVQAPPDRLWYEARPTLIGALCGDAASSAIPTILKAVASYPHKDAYRVWPGPNSNTFVAHLIRETPGLDVILPATAIGKDYLPGGAWASTRKGVELSAKGLAGLSVGPGVRLDISLLTVSFGFSLRGDYIRMPVFGGVGGEGACG
ncbi:MAG: DUF3750 domain-containing protein [Magnetococcales bacterium]|nr:DUF3750 domain-containing protein [Magnetococcales bacterium]